MNDPTGSSVYRYERRGLLRSEAKTIAGSTYTTAFGHDANGNRSILVYPSGLVATYTFDFADRPYSLTAGTATVISDATYLPFGPLNGITFGNGTTRPMQFDTRYHQLTNRLIGPAGTIADYSYSWDAVGNPVVIFDETDNNYTRFFGYDDLNRLISTSSGAALWVSGSYTYDRMGNTTALSLGTRVLQFSYEGTTPKIHSVIGTSPSLPTYDSAGNELTFGRSYGARNFMKQIATPPVSFDYGYDGRGVRVSTTSTSTLPLSHSFRRHAFYSPELQILSRSAWQDTSVPGSATIATDFLWFAGQPVAQKPAAGALRYTFADHLGTPILQTDAAASVTWRAEYEPYGNIFSMRVGAAGDQPLRLPGQEVAEFAEDTTEQSYNIFRWYRSSWGRYTQADPQGIDTDIHVYRYAFDNPLNWADPLGLRPCSSQAPTDLARFAQAYDVWFANPRLGLGQQNTWWGPLGNVAYVCTFGRGGSSCTGWAVGLLNALQPLNTECCRAVERQQWFPLPHTTVDIQCRCDTTAAQWRTETNYDPFWRLW